MSATGVADRAREIADAILSDGEWHRLDDVVAEMAQHIGFGPAVRADRERLKRRRQREGRTRAQTVNLEHEARRGSDLIAKREAAAAIKAGDWRQDDDRVCMVRPFASGGDVIAQASSAPLTADEARVLVHRLNASLANVVDLVGRLYAGRAWEALGHESWEALCRAEVRVPRLDRGERAEVVLELRAAGLSTRAIGSAVGIGDATVRRDLATASDDAVAPETVVGLDGAERSTRRPTGSPGTPRRYVQVRADNLGLAIQRLEEHYLVRIATIVVGDERVDLVIDEVGEVDR